MTGTGSGIMAFAGIFNAARFCAVMFAALFVLVLSGGSSDAAPSYDQFKSAQLVDNIASFPYASCNFIREQDLPGEEHCDHVVKRLASASRVKLLRRTPEVITTAPVAATSQYSAEPTFSLVIARAELLLAKPRSPFKAMFAITTSMLN